mgnify:CR=1 FL=1
MTRPVLSNGQEKAGIRKLVNIVQNEEGTTRKLIQDGTLRFPKASSTAILDLMPELEVAEYLAIKELVVNELPDVSTKEEVQSVTKELPTNVRLKCKRSVSDSSVMTLLRTYFPVDTFRKMKDWLFQAGVTVTISPAPFGEVRSVQQWLEDETRADPTSRSSNEVSISTQHDTKNQSSAPPVQDPFKATFKRRKLSRIEQEKRDKYSDSSVKAKIPCLVMHKSEVDITAPKESQGFTNREDQEKLAKQVVGNRGLLLCSRIGVNSSLWKNIAAGRIDNREARWVILGKVSAATTAAHLAKIESMERVAKDQLQTHNIWRSGPSNFVNVSCIVEIFRIKFKELEARNIEVAAHEKFGRSSLRSMLNAIEWCERQDGIGLTKISDLLQVPHTLSLVAEREFSKMEVNKAPFLSNDDLVCIEEVACGFYQAATTCDAVFCWMLCLLAWCGHRFQNIQSMSTADLKRLLDGEEVVLRQDKVNVRKTVSLNKACYVKHKWANEFTHSLLPMSPARDCLVPAVSNDFTEWLDYPLTNNGASTWLARIWRITGRDNDSRINSFRRSFTRDALASGLDEASVRRLLRWKTESMVCYYTDNSGHDSHLRASLRSSRRTE